MAFRVKDAMKAKIVTVAANAGVEEVCQLMFRSNATCVPVVDHTDRYLGMLTEMRILQWRFDPMRSTQIASDWS